MWNTSSEKRAGVGFDSRFQRFGVLAAQRGERGGNLPQCPVGVCLRKGVVHVRLDQDAVVRQFLHELAVVYGVVVQDCGSDGDISIERDDVGDKPVGTGETVEEEGT